MDRADELAIARREMEKCISERGKYSDPVDRMGLTLGEMDWTCEVLRIEEENGTRKR